MIRTGNGNQSQAQPWDGQEGLWEQGWHPQGECQVQSEPWGNRVRSGHKPGEPQVNSSSQDLECLSCSHPLLLHCQGTSLQGGQQKRGALSCPWWLVSCPWQAESVPLQGSCTHYPYAVPSGHHGHLASTHVPYRMVLHTLEKDHPSHAKVNLLYTRNFWASKV